MAAGTQKYEPFARNGSWSAQSTNPVPKIQAGASKVQLELKASCFNLWFAPNYALTSWGLARKVPALTFLRKALWKRLENASEKASENVSENAVWGAEGAPQRGEACRGKVKHGEQTWRDLG